MITAPSEPTVSVIPFPRAFIRAGEDDAGRDRSPLDARVFQEVMVERCTSAAHHVLAVPPSHTGDEATGDGGRASSRCVLWVSDAMSALELGHPQSRAGGSASHLVWVRPRDARDALWAMELGLRSPGVDAVVGEIYGDPAVLDFTASRRLALAAERHDTPCALMRVMAKGRSSAARRRWRVEAVPSAANPHDPSAPGDPRWRLVLERARDRAPGGWFASREHDGRLSLDDAARHPFAPDMPATGAMRHGLSLVDAGWSRDAAS